MTHLRPHIGRDGESYSQPFCAHLAECDPYTICSSPQWKYTVSLKSYESLSGDIYNPCTKLSLLHLIPGSKITIGLKPPIIIVLYQALKKYLNKCFCKRYSKKWNSDFVEFNSMFWSLWSNKFIIDMNQKGLDIIQSLCFWETFILCNHYTAS